MGFPSHPFAQLFRLSLLLLLLPTASLTLTQGSFGTIFNLHPPASAGGCGRNTINNVPMMPYLLTAVEDALGMAQDAHFQIYQTMFPTPTRRRVRGLFYIILGITFVESGQPSPGSRTRFTYVDSVFEGIVNLFSISPSDRADRPFFHCLVDYAFCTKQLVGNDGLENISAPLAAVTFNRRLPKGDYFPGMMYAVFAAIYYDPSWTNPLGGMCGLGGSFAFTLDSGSLGWGITICGSGFDLANLGPLGQLAEDAGDASTIREYARTGGVTLLREMVHLVVPGIIDQPLSYPPNGDFENDDWPSWI